MYQVLHSASAMQAALEDRLPRGARVQVLDSDYGAFLAMARAGMRQATPHIQWFSLVFAEDSVRHQFLAALEDNPPAAILLTNSQWPQPHGSRADRPMNSCPLRPHNQRKSEHSAKSRSCQKLT
jgi:hypothetical protein